MEVERAHLSCTKPVAAGGLELFDESNAHNDRLCESGISAIAKNCFDVMYLKTDTEMFLRCLFRGMMNKSEPIHTQKPG